MVDWIRKTSTSEGQHEIQWTTWMQLDDSDYTDDLDIPSQPQQQMQMKTVSVAVVSASACTREEARF
ncbi:unnamed protein product [Schistosoma margrebowiei]|uniref:Uncharacterized protein n=1 Tax=Schistosoma margrebowiei TaxID=48269 RepID=A0A183M6K4_9TREM|nr:unnamed protein product [Schistosoma margrebowiei]